MRPASPASCGSAPRLSRPTAARLKFWRRKGRKNTLLGGAGNPLPDDALAPFLGGLSQEVFERSFGLDANKLRAGGDEMLQADGDVGASLMAAASGLRGLAELRRSLEVEADGVFAPRAGKDRRFYQALERFNAARAAIREKELRSDAWVKLNKDIEELGRELEPAARRAPGRRNRAVAPEPAQAHGAAPRPHSGDRGGAGVFQRPARLRARGDAGLAGGARRIARSRARKRSGRESTRSASLRNWRASTLTRRCLSDAAAIEELFQASGGYKDAKRDLPAVQREADGFLAALDRHARSLGLADVGSLERRRPTDAAKTEARKLIKQGRDTEAAANAKAAQLSQAQKSCEAARIAREAQGADLDPAPLREKYAALGKDRRSRRGGSPTVGSR